VFLTQSDQPISKSIRSNELAHSLTINSGTVLLRWQKAPDAARYNIHRADRRGNVRFENAAKVTRWEDGGAERAHPTAIMYAPVSPPARAVRSSTRSLHHSGACLSDSAHGRDSKTRPRQQGLRRTRPSAPDRGQKAEAAALRIITSQ
jgi:hypothetical protein